MQRQPPRLSGEAKRAAPPQEASRSLPNSSSLLYSPSIDPQATNRSEPDSRGGCRYVVADPFSFFDFSSTPRASFSLCSDKFLGDRGIRQPNHLRRENPRVRRPRFSNCHGRNGNPRRHLHRRQQ